MKAVYSPLVIDGARVQTIAAFDDLILQWSGFDDYGRNLDALWDVLTGIVDPPILIQWKNAALSRDAMGAGFERIVNVIRDAEARYCAEWPAQTFEFRLEE